MRKSFVAGWNRSRRWLLSGFLSGLALCGGIVVSNESSAATAHSGSTVTSNAPPSTDWPVFGNDLNASFFSTQNQITTSNVKKLGVAWRKSLGPEQFLVEGYPIETDGKLFITTSSDVVQAYNAATGKLLWQHAANVDFSQSTGIGGYSVSTNRGVAVSNGKVYELTFDDHLDALQEATGEQLWSSKVADDSTGAYETMQPTVYNGLVFVGVSGSQDGIRGFVAAYNAKTGKQVWRFYTVPRRGTEWVPKNGGGGGVYMPPTVDPTTGLVYVGTSTPAPVLYGAGRKGADLYTDSILALKMKTGKLVWHYQEIPHDLWNYGADSPVMLFNLEKDGTTTRALAEAGKDGRVYILNAKTGKLLYKPLPYVKVNHPPPTKKGTLVCPGSIGGSPYSPLALDPTVGAAYVSGINLCQILTVVPKGVVGGEKEFAGSRATPPHEVPSGTFDAVNLKTGKFLWQRKMSTPMIGGAAATAGGLVFTGDQHGNFYGIDARTGKTLWKVNLKLAFGSAPIVYTIGKTEYVAAAIGGSATTAASSLGQTGAELVVFKLGGKPIKG